MAEDTPRVAYVFPGQGSQAFGMGLGLYKQSSAAQQVWHAADASGNELLTPHVFDGVAESLRPTDVQQPAIVATSIAALAAFNEELGLVIEVESKKEQEVIRELSKVTLCNKIGKTQKNRVKIQYNNTINHTIQ